MICMQKNNSPYTSLTGCTFLYYEFKRILPVLMSADAEKLLKEEVENNQILQVNSRTSRQRFAVEFKRRYAAVPAQFWREWLHWSEAGQRAGLFYAILKAYKLVFDFHVNVAMKKWNSIDHKLTADDIQMEFNEISAHDAFVDGWSAATKKEMCQLLSDHPAADRIAAGENGRADSGQARSGRIGLLHPYGRGMVSGSLFPLSV